MKKYILKIVLALNFIILAVPLLAFPGDPDGGEDPPFEDPTPIDANLGILIFIAVSLGIYLLTQFKKEFKST